MTLFSVRENPLTLEENEAYAEAVKKELMEKKFTIEAQEYINEYLTIKNENIKKQLYQEKYQRLIESISKSEIDTYKITTGLYFEDYKIVEYKGIVSGETVLGTGFLSEISASISDTFGIKANSFRTKLELAKDDAIRLMIINSIVKKGNALIGVDIKYLTFQNNMIGVIATGTSVIIE